MGRIPACVSVRPARMSRAHAATSRSWPDLTLGSHVASVTPLPARRRAHASRQRVVDAVDAERARTRAWLHDTLLQQLEYIAAGGYADEVDPRELMRVAAAAATELRA